MDISIRDNPRYNWWLLLGLLAGIYLLINLALPLLTINASVKAYVLQPLLWGLLAGAVLLLPRYRPVAKLRIRSSFIQLALMIGFFQVAILVIGGLFSGFGQSPYSFTPLGIITNLIFVGSMLIGMEMSRAWLVNRLGKRHTFLALAFVALLYTLLAIPLAQIQGLGPALESVTFLNSTLLPSLAENLLATFLALLAGPLAAIVYRGTLLAFWWFLPALPDLPWVLQGLIGTVVPIVGLVVVQRFYAAKTERGRRGRAKEGRFPVGWIVTTIVAVAIIWFSVGLFPFHPALVGSGSMRPAMDVGDVVIIAKVPADTVTEGDIIQFRQGDDTVMHRVVEIQEIEGATFFITQGDANNEPDDDPVIPENVVGKLVLTIPKIGWVAIAIKNFFTG
jgi:signal peptidase